MGELIQCQKCANMVEENCTVFLLSWSCLKLFSREMCYFQVYTSFLRLSYFFQESVI